MFAFLSQLDIYTASQEEQMEDSSDLDCYEPVHVTLGCNCKTVVVVDKILGSLAENGRTIIVSLDDGNYANPLRVKELAPSQPDTGTRYTAISHVRGEGLGNSMASSLPLCQIRLLQRFVDGLEGTAAGTSFFWIDSLCVPVDRRTKKLAARNIRQIFTKASGVLVVNPTIMATARVSCDERLHAIAASAWPKRLWTLQEGAVAKRLHFQFRDKAVELDKLLGTTSSVEMSESSQRLLNQIYRFGDDIKMDGFPRPFRYGTGVVSRHQAKTTLRYYLRLCLLMLPMFQRFATLREQLRLPSIKMAIDAVYPSDDTGSDATSASQTREAQLCRLCTVLELEPPTTAIPEFIL